MLYIKCSMYNLQLFASLLLMFNFNFQTHILNWTLQPIWSSQQIYMVSDNSRTFCIQNHTPMHFSREYNSISNIPDRFIHKYNKQQNILKLLPLSAKSFAKHFIYSRAWTIFILLNKQPAFNFQYSTLQKTFSPFYLICFIICFL